MSYMYDIFISYKRDPWWMAWHHDYLRNLIRTFLVNDLHREPKIFIDREIQTSSDWPIRLGEALARSSVLVAVLNSNYFRSYWCRHELDLMLDRLSCFPKRQIIVPLVVHNCERLPAAVGRIGLTYLKEFYNPHIQGDSAMYYRFSEEVKRLCPTIATAIHSAPAFDSNWIRICTSRFNDVYLQTHGNGSAKFTQLETKDVSYDDNFFPRVDMS
jgi:hypothetical protein